MTTQAKHIVVLLERTNNEPVSSRAPTDGGGAASGEPLASCERAALGMALQLRSDLGATVTAMALGGGALPRASLDAALRAGCDRAVCLATPEDSGLTFSDLDYLTVASGISAALSRLGGCDLLLCSDRAQDELQGIVGPAIAELQDIPHLTGVMTAHVEDADRGDDDEGEGDDDAGKIQESSPGQTSIIVEHRGGGEHHRFRCRLPVTLCVLAGDGSDLPAIDASESDDPDASAIEELSLSALEIDVEAVGRPASAPMRPVRRGYKGAVITDPSNLVKRLVDDHLLRPRAAPELDP